MKTYICIILSIILVFSLSACGGKETVSESKQNQGSSSVLSTTENSFENYEGMWSESDISFENGGLILEIATNKTKMTIDCSLTSSGPSSRIAEFEKTFKLSKIVNNTVKISYEEDGWGNSGVLELTFSKDYILAEFKEIVADEMANWGFNENTYKLIKNEKAQETLSEGSNEYYEEQSDIIESSTPSYDLSKASGILAQKGMTEEEFRDSCQALNHSKYHYHLSEKTTVPFVEIVDLQRNPNAYIGQHFVFSENPYREVICPQCDGTGYYNQYSNSSYKSYCSDSDFRYRKNGVHYQREKDLSKLVPYELLGRNKTTSVDGYSVLTGTSSDIFLIYDLRDDIYSPNITSDSTVVAYMIFDGVTSNNMLQFSMISCDVIYDD